MKSITLHNGDLRFSALLYGDDQGAPMVVCLHGFPDNNNSFRYQVDALLSAGYRILVPAMRGYEPSSITEHNHYHTNYLVDDLFSWLAELEVDTTHLIGHDWGAAVAYSAAARSPEKILSLTTIAVPHPKRFSREGLINVPAQGFKSWYMLFNQIPFLSEYMAKQKDWAYIKFLWQRWSPQQKLSTEEWRSLEATYAQAGVMSAMLAYYRSNVSLLQLIGLRKNDLNSLSTIPVPNLAITGAEDGCIDTRVFDHAIMAEDHPAGCDIKRIQGAGHFVHQEKPEVINPMIIDWLKQHDT